VNTADESLCVSDKDVMLFVVLGKNIISETPTSNGERLSMLRHDFFVVVSTEKASKEMSVFGINI